MNSPKNVGKEAAKKAASLSAKRMLDCDELGHYIGLSPQTIRNKYYAGQFPIPAKRIFRKVLWDIRDVDRYLDRLHGN